jgi:hypothetical protein
MHHIYIYRENLCHKAKAKKSQKAFNKRSGTVGAHEHLGTAHHLPAATKKYI